MSSLLCPKSKRHFPASFLSRFILGASILGVVLTVLGGNLTLQNPSFEDLVLSPGEYTENGTGLASWTTSPGEAVGVWNVSNLTDFPGGAPEGNNVAYSQGPSISQVLPDVVVEGNSYQLQLQVGTSPCCGFPGYSIQLRADGVTLVEEAAIVFGPPAGTFEQITLTYDSLPGDSNAGNQLALFLQSWGAEIVFNQVVLTSQQQGSADWELIDVNGEISRSSPAMAYDSAREVMVMFGGRSGASLNDTWEFDGTSWAQVSTSSAPPPRFWHAMVYDSHRQRIVLFGGQNGTGDYFNDTWEYDGANWQQINTGHSPPPMAVKTMVFDSGRNKTVLVGGEGPGVSGTDTWEYDGADWVMVDVSSSPPSPGTLAAMAYDSDRQRSVLTFNAGGQNLSTWEYDGSGWSEVSTLAAPATRWAHAMAYSPQSQETLLYGGYSPSLEDVLNDTWAFNGSEWSLIETRNSPPATEQHAMAYDTVAGRLVSLQWGETWVYAQATPKPDLIFADNFEGDGPPNHAPEITSQPVTEGQTVNVHPKLPH